MQWDEELLPESLDERVQELMDIKDYFDSLVESGRLYEDYTLNPDYEEDSVDDETEETEDGLADGEFIPKMGEDYWDEEEQRFDVEWWEDELTDHMNLLKIDAESYTKDPAMFVRDTIGYEFINENLLRQAFTRRAFAVEYGLPGCNEELEFLGDTVLNTVVTRDMLRQLAWVDEYRTKAPFTVRLQEGGLTKIRSAYVNKEFLAGRVAELGLDKLILYGTGEEPTESSREDVLEALLGAAAIDSNWDWVVLGAVVDRLVCVQVEKPDYFLKESFYDIFNAWHQRRFGVMPDYEMQGISQFHCALRFRVPANDKGIREAQRIDVDGCYSRSLAREQAAMQAYEFVRHNGLWIDLKEAGITPELENSINQLQELYQKKYVEQLPVYEFTEEDGDSWYCICRCNGVAGTGYGASKTKAKKEAAYMVLRNLFHAAGMK
jgi:ribonuclease-3